MYAAIGQVPTNGGYVVGAAARKPIFGMGQNECPPGEIGIPPFCVPNPMAPDQQPPPPPPEGAPAPAPGCPSGQTEILGQCYNVPPCPTGEREVLGVCYPESVIGAQLPGQAPKQEPKKAGMPGWVLPAAIGVGAVALVAVVATRGRKR